MWHVWGDPKTKRSLQRRTWLKIGGLLNLTRPTSDGELIITSASFARLVTHKFKFDIFKEKDFGLSFRKQENWDFCQEERMEQLLALWHVQSTLLRFCTLLHTSVHCAHKCGKRWIVKLLSPSCVLSASNKHVCSPLCQWCRYNGADGWRCVVCWANPPPLSHSPPRVTRLRLVCSLPSDAAGCKTHHSHSPLWHTALLRGTDSPVHPISPHLWYFRTFASVQCTLCSARW